MGNLRPGDAPRQGVADMWRRIRRAEADIKFLRSARNTVSRATVADGKSLIIRGILSVVGALNLTGTLSMKSAGGGELVRIGDMTFGRGLAIAREDGTVAFVVAKAFDNSTAQTWGLFDRDGSPIVSEEPLVPGLGRPRLEHPFQPVAATSGTAVSCGPFGWERSTTSAVYETLFVYDGRHQNAFLDFKFAAACTDGTTAGDIIAVDLTTGLQLATFIGVPWVASIPAGSTVMGYIDPDPVAAVLPGAVDDYIRVGVQARRTAGAGTITLAVPLAIGG